MSDIVEQLKSEIECLRQRLSELDWCDDMGKMPTDESLLEFYSPLGGVFIAPAISARSLTTQERRKIYEHDGTWANVGYNPTHWRRVHLPTSSSV